MSLGGFRDIVENTEEQRRTFFKLVFGPEATGHVCIAFKEHATGHFQQLWFEYPNQLEDLLTSINNNTRRLAHFWFSTAVFNQPGDRHKVNIKYSTIIHCDLDECDPRLLLVEPSILIQSSPGRYQALWLLEQPITPSEAENVNTRIYYYHRDQGADACHDAGHLLRIPYTPNLKYGDLSTAPVVSILHSKRNLYRASDFDVYPGIPALKFLEKHDELPDLPQQTADGLIAHYHDSLHPNFHRQFLVTPDENKDGKWSTVLWNMMKYCLEAGMKREETFIVASAAACNKYKRDNRGELALWQDVQRCYVKQIEHFQLLPTSTSTIPELLTEPEIRLVQGRETFIERYMGWAKELTDAPLQYHQAGAFIILSALLSGNVYLSTSHDRIYPNLWFMILAGTTLTRKSTAMRIAMNTLRDVDTRPEMATDGSIEGILAGLRDRPGQPSIFLKDEFTGLLEAIAHKDYMAGFAEQLTKLYDGDNIKRLLRKETIEITNPRFIVFAGGIKDRTQELLTEEQVMSGFIPRFVFISGESNVENIRPTRPPEAEVNQEARELLKNELMDIFNYYCQPTPVYKDGRLIGSMPADVEAGMTSEAWQRFNQFEKQMMETAMSTGLDYLMPVYVRLSVSTLKAAILLAAARKRESYLLVEEVDILHAIYYCQRWREYASEIVNGVGKTYDERLIDRIMRYITNNPLGVTRAELMSMYHLDMKRADMLFGTMLQRNMIYSIEVNGQRKYRQAGAI